MSTVFKTVSFNEYNIMKIMSDNLIGPLIISHNLNGGKIDVEMEKYNLNWYQYKQSKGDLDKYDPLIREIVEKLHKLGYIHGDLHDANIIIDTDKDRVALIDFSTTMKTIDIDTNMLSIFTVNDIVDYEKISWID